MFHFTRLNIGDEETMSTSTIGVIEALKWTKTSTSVDFQKWFKIFECSLIINAVDMTEQDGKAKAKAMLYAYGGDKIRANLELLATYSTATYAEAVAHLKTTFMPWMTF